jgi:hypothetical protein
LREADVVLDLLAKVKGGLRLWSEYLLRLHLFSPAVGSGCGKLFYLSVSVN